MRVRGVSERGGGRGWSRPAGTRPTELVGGVGEPAVFGSPFPPSLSVSAGFAASARLVYEAGPAFCREHRQGGRGGAARVYGPTDRPALAPGWARGPPRGPGEQPLRRTGRVEPGGPGARQGLDAIRPHPNRRGENQVLCP